MWSSCFIQMYQNKIPGLTGDFKVLSFNLYYIPNFFLMSAGMAFLLTIMQVVL
jgi:hypothetical protein